MFLVLKNNINFINAGLILITSILIMILCELEERSKLLFTIGVITMGIAVALLIITITLYLTSTFSLNRAWAEKLPLSWQVLSNLCEPIYGSISSCYVSLVFPQF